MKRERESPDPLKVEVCNSITHTDFGTKNGDQRKFDVTKSSKVSKECREKEKKRKKIERRREEGERKMIVERKVTR